MFVIKVVSPEGGYDVFEALRYCVNTDHTDEVMMYEDRMQKATFYHEDGSSVAYVLPYFKPDTCIYIMNEQGKTIDRIT